MSIAQKLTSPKTMLVSIGGIAALTTLILPKIGVSKEAKKIPEPSIVGLRFTLNNSDASLKLLSNIQSNFATECKKLRGLVTSGASTSEMEQELRVSGKAFEELSQQCANFTAAWVQSHPEANGFSTNIGISHPTLGALEGKRMLMPNNFLVDASSALNVSLPRSVRRGLLDFSAMGLKMPRLADDFKKHTFFYPGKTNTVITSQDTVEALPKLIQYAGAWCKDAGNKLNDLFAPLDADGLGRVVDALRIVDVAIRQAQELAPLVQTNAMNLKP